MRSIVAFQSAISFFSIKRFETRKRMLHITVSYLAWIVVVLIQAFVHFWILKGSKRRDEAGLSKSSLDKMDASVADDKRVLKLRKHKLVEPDDQVPPMVPHVQVSEDEYEEEPEQESFDGDEPLLFFELLDKTGSEMIEVCWFRN